MEANPFSDVFLRNNTAYLDRLVRSKKGGLLFRVNPKLKRLYREYQETQGTDDEKNLACAKVLDAYEERLFWRLNVWRRCAVEDLRLFLKHFRGRKTIDRSDPKARDYYSVAAIVKNECRYLREFILFYLATGADRIYLYDNESTDDTMDVIRPFIEKGQVVYRRWPGRAVQAAAYRDAARRTKRRTRWLAFIDADEFLFSPKGQMPQMLSAYEKYPGIGANWLMYGPNGHEKRPEGLVMDNYTTTIRDYGVPVNCHTKSIVQPKQFLCMFNPHYAIYKGGRFAVNEDGEIIDNFSSFSEQAGRVFTKVNHRAVFRVNHYSTRSLEDLRVKCERGYPDGSANAVFEEQLRIYRDPQTEDFTIKAYADLVRKSYGAIT
ncbi:MAG: glycosyltransferase family 2 protein [Lachnospiraceae bacterium]|nr:glycosyltransferase family 2 protein [Lachnospiraceae bacterium]